MTFRVKSEQELSRIDLTSRFDDLLAFQAYEDATDHYSTAWSYQGQSNARIGYRLAFNMLKAKRYTGCVEVCQKVLKRFPKYPKIRSDILERAQGLLRL